MKSVAANAVVNRSRMGLKVQLAELLVLVLVGNFNFAIGDLRGSLEVTTNDDKWEGAIDGEGLSYSFRHLSEATGPSWECLPLEGLDADELDQYTEECPDYDDKASCESPALLCRWISTEANAPGCFPSSELVDSDEIKVWRKLCQTLTSADHCMSPFVKCEWFDGPEWEDASDDVEVAGGCVSERGVLGEDKVEARRICPEQFDEQSCLNTNAHCEWNVYNLSDGDLDNTVGHCEVDPSLDKASREEYLEVCTDLDRQETCESPMLGCVWTKGSLQTDPNASAGRCIPNRSLSARDRVSLWRVCIEVGGEADCLSPFLDCEWQAEQPIIGDAKCIPAEHLSLHMKMAYESICAQETSQQGCSLDQNCQWKPTGTKPKCVPEDNLSSELVDIYVQICAETETRSVCDSPALACKWTDMEGDGELCPLSCPRPWLGDHYCDAECNILACNFDDGDCIQDESDVVTETCDHLGAPLPYVDHVPPQRWHDHLKVTVDGGGSVCKDCGPNDAVSFAWRFVSQPHTSHVTDASIENRFTATPYFYPDAPGDYELELMFSNRCHDSYDRVTIEVFASQCAPNSTLSERTKHRYEQMCAEAKTERDCNSHHTACEWFDAP